MRSVLAIIQKERLALLCTATSLWKQNENDRISLKSPQEMCKIDLFGREQKCCGSNENYLCVCVFSLSISLRRSFICVLNQHRTLNKHIRCTLTLNYQYHHHHSSPTDHLHRHLFLRPSVLSSIFFKGQKCSPMNNVTNGYCCRCQSMLI